MIKLPTGWTLRESRKKLGSYSMDLDWRRFHFRQNCLIIHQMFLAGQFSPTDGGSTISKTNALEESVLIASRQSPF
jgi:hypothetical protein